MPADEARRLEDHMGAKRFYEGCQFDRQFREATMSTSCFSGKPKSQLAEEFAGRNKLYEKLALQHRPREIVEFKLDPPSLKGMLDVLIYDDCVETGADSFWIFDKFLDQEVERTLLLCK